MSESWQAKLRRLGIQKGTRKLKPASKPPRELPPPAQMADEQEPISLTEMIPAGRVAPSAEDGCFVVDRVYPMSHMHGDLPLESLLGLSAEAAAIFCQDPRLADIDLTKLLFLDTETTGLAGAGTLAFMVGVGYFEPSATGQVFVVRQYFLRDHADEPAMLDMLDALLDGKDALVTFNGRSFDVPLLDTRYLMNRMPGRITTLPHIDLLPPARRLYRMRLGSCALGALEGSLLGVHRTHQDVEGWLIPMLYKQYLQTDNARELGRVFYHNQLDMLSMVTLMAKILRQFSAPSGDDPALDVLSLGKWEADLGLADLAEVHLRLAAEGDLPLDAFHIALGRLGVLLKRAERHDEALPFWQQWAATTFEDVTPHVELAKHFEWRQHRLDEALAWTERALALVGSWTHLGRVRTVRPELEHRRARLLRKMGLGE